MKINKTFVGSKMNKSLDERLIPKGDYVDGQNIRVSSDEDGEAGSIENAKGNTQLTLLRYNNSAIEDAKTIGAYEDGESETLYWFVTSPTVDVIASFNTRTQSLVQHVVSTSVLNFHEDYRINGVDLIDDLLFFTDNYNQPRRINVKDNYLKPIEGVDQIIEDDISVIVRLPIESPKIKLIKKSTGENYIKDKFLRFATRNKYKNGEYSPLSEFSDVAFDPKNFNIDYNNYDMTGMQNTANSVNVSFSTGSKDVVAVDLCFKVSNTNVINVVEKFNKLDEGWNDNETVEIPFDNKKIYTTLPESELLRSYDNVPRLAKTQTTIGNRIMYGNYVDGYDIKNKIDYTLELNSKDIGFSELSSVKSNGSNYNIEASRTVENSAVSIDFTGSDILKGGAIYIDLSVTHKEFTGNALYTDAPENIFQNNISFEFIKTYSSVQDLANSDEFLEAIQSSLTISEAVNGYSLTDLFYSGIQSKTGWTLVGGGVDSSEGDFKVTSSGNVLTIQIPAVKYEDDLNPGNFSYEYFEITNVFSSINKINSRGSLHSNRDYEVGIVYLDEYNRASTALVSTKNTVFVAPRLSIFKNSITATIKNTAPEWAKRYRFVLKTSKSSYDTLYSNLFFYDPIQSAWWCKLEGDNQTKVVKDTTLIVKKSSSGTPSNLLTVKVLEIEVKKENFIDENEIAPSGVYMKIKPNGFSINNTDDNPIVDYGTSSHRNTSIKYSTSIINPEYTVGGSENKYIEYTVPSGSQVTFYIHAEQFGKWANKWEFKRTFVASRNYENMYDFISGERIDFNRPTLEPTSRGSGENDTDAIWNNDVGDGQGLSDFEEYHSDNLNVTPYTFTEFKIQYFRDESNGHGFLTFKNPNEKESGPRHAYMDVSIEVIRADDVLVLETQPLDNPNEFYYESHESHAINDGYHTGNVTNQSNGVDAVVDLNLYDCFTFGNGVESFKIDDAFSTPGFKIGSRVTAVAEEDYKEARRYADITYSGVYNEETNVNKLNSFNLGLVNWVTLEKSFGPINKLHARQSDILVLQEDKISTVLANGKNLFSDASAGGAILSTPDVLGQQIPRVEEFGLSNNAESFAVYGFDTFFTDSKRGATINLVGDSLDVISSKGMGSWFRDKFIKNDNKVILGGYDPYTNEYVIAFKPQEETIETVDIISCGTEISRINANSSSTYNVSYSSVIGTSMFNYNVFSGSVVITANYNGIEVINETITGSSSGAIPISKNAYNVDEMSFTVLASDDASYNIEVGCVEAEELTVIRMVTNETSLEGQTIHHDYTWSESGHIGVTQSDFLVLLNSGLSLSKSKTGLESTGSIPIEGASILMRSIKQESDTASFQRGSFKYLVSDTLYTDISLLNPLLINSTSVFNSTTETYDTSFVYQNPNNYQYLYLVWEYKVPSISLNLCFSSVSESELCCGSANPVTVWVEDGETFNTAINLYADESLTTLATDGWYSDDLTLSCYQE